MNKTETALLYFPDSTPKVAVRHLMRWKYRLASFLKVDKDKVIMALEDCENIENNQSLFIINKKELYEKSRFK